MKKILSLALVCLMLVFAMAGCGSKDEGTTGKTDADQTQAETGNEGATGGVIKIGGIGPITGGAAVYGIATMNGAQIAVDEINAAGGINGKQIEFKFEDDVHDPEKSINAYYALRDWGMQILMGTVTSTPCTAVAAETYADNMFQLTPSGSAVECVENDNAFRVCFSDPNQGGASATYIADNAVAQKVGIIYNSSDVYSTGIYKNFVEVADEKNLEIVGAEAFTDDNKTDFSVQLQKLQSSGAELVFLPIYYTEASLILTQANKMGFTPVFFGCDGLDGILNVENFDTSLAEGVMLLTPFAADADDELTQKFVATYNDKFGETPIQFAADGYDAIYIIKAAMEKAGVTSDDPSEICEALKTAMTEITVDGLTGEGITWTADGEPNKAPKAVIIKDGVYVSAN